MSRVAAQIDIPSLKKVASGKVREIFDLGDHFLFVATDRLSAFDVILPDPIPNKGRVLTQLSKFWFELLHEEVANHMVSTDFAKLPASLQEYRALLDGRFMIVKKLEMVPVECVVRGYLVGSGYKEYSAQGTVCGMKLPPDLQLAQKLEEPIFTPAAKISDGHDENISFQTMVDMVGKDLAERLRDLSLLVYNKAAAHARGRGVLIADTKFEFGLQEGQIVLADEVLTPDSSRYWPADSYRTGSNPPSYDKQFVRDYLSDLGWNHKPPAPRLPEELLAGTSKRYLECYERIVGTPLAS